MLGSVNADSSRPIPPNMADAPTIDTQGTMFPGLVELHNHPSYRDYGKAPSLLRSFHSRNRGLVPP
jgi:hypothetical protein